MGALPIEAERACCFTGSRFLASEVLQELKEGLRGWISYLARERSVTQFLCGGAIGFDLLAADQVLELREQEEFAHLELYMIYPCKGQESKWTPDDRSRFYRIRQKATSFLYIQENYTADCMLERNRYLVNHSSYCLYYRNSTAYRGGGTAYTLAYAQKKGHISYSVLDSQFSL